MGRQRRGEGRVLKLGSVLGMEPARLGGFCFMGSKNRKVASLSPVVVKRSVVKSSSQGGLGYI